MATAPAIPYVECTPRGVRSLTSPGRRLPGRGAAAWSILSATLVCASCGGGPPSPSPGPATRPLSECPPPLRRAFGRVQPSRVRLENRTSDTLNVWLDRCFRYTRMADVAPGGSVQVELPERLVAFPEGLRFHAFVEHESRYVGVFTVPVEEVPILRLVLADETLADRASLVRLQLPADRHESGFLVGGEASAGYVSAVSSGGRAVLTWACDGEGGQHVSVGSGRSWGVREIEVLLRVDHGLWEDLGSWRVQEGFTDTALAPPSRIEALTRRALAAAELAFVLAPQGGGREAHAFRVAGLAQALAERPCFAPPGGA